MPKINDIIYDAGDCWSAVSPIKVTEKNIFLIREFWNRLYFASANEAEQVNRIMHCKYGSCQNTIFSRTCGNI